MNDIIKNRVNRIYYEQTIFLYCIAILDLDLTENLIKKLNHIHVSKLNFIRHFYWEYRNEYIFSDDNTTTITNKIYSLLDKLQQMPEYVKNIFEIQHIGFIDAIIEYIKNMDFSNLDDNVFDVEEIDDFWIDLKK
jgi:hypothetical protein